MVSAALTGEIARLAEVTANLDAHIAAAAERIAAPRIAEVQSEAEQRLAEQRDAAAAEQKCAADLNAELRRQLQGRLCDVARLRWAARYLPPALRRLVLGADPSRPGAWAGDRPDERFVATLDAVAVEAGLVPYPSARLDGSSW